jgi:DNA-binding NarL/FixJ family response regulator
LANKARKQVVAIKAKPYSPSMAKVYEKEVESLKSKVKESESNAPKERMAQVYANAVYRAKKLDNPNMSNDDKKKVKQQALATGRVRYGAKKAKVEITDKEWDAIQAGAMSSSFVDRILNNADLDQVKEFALPKSKANSTGLTAAKKSRILSLLKNGYTIADVADQFGVSTSTISKVKNEKNGGSD